MVTNTVTKSVVLFTSKWNIPRLHKLEYMDGEDKSLPLSYDHVKLLLRHCKLYRKDNGVYCNKTGDRIGNIIPVKITKIKDRFTRKVRNPKINTNHLSSLKEAEKKMIILVMKYTKGNLTDASRILEINTMTLSSKLRKHGLSKKIILNQGDQNDN